MVKCIFASNGRRSDQRRFPHTILSSTRSPPPRVDVSVEGETQRKKCGSKPQSCSAISSWT